MMNRFYLVGSLATVLVIAGGCAPKNKALELRSLDRIYLAVQSTSSLTIESLLGTEAKDDFFPEEEVPPSEMDMVPTSTEVVIARKMVRAWIIYTDESFVPSGKSYRPMRVWICCSKVLEDDKIGAIHVNPEITDAESYVISEREIAKSMHEYPKWRPLNSGVCFQP